MKENNIWRCDDEPPSKIQTSKSANNSNWSVNHTLGTFIGFCFGEGRYAIGAVVLCFQLVISLADGYVWFWVMENMKDKMEKELAPG